MEGRGLPVVAREGEDGRSVRRGREAALGEVDQGDERPPGALHDPSRLAAGTDPLALGAAREDFDHFWTYVSPTWAGKYLDHWCAMVLRSGIEPMKAKARMLQSHRDLVLNYFRAKKEYSPGVVEGL